MSTKVHTLMLRLQVSLIYLNIYRGFFSTPCSLWFHIIAPPRFQINFEEKSDFCRLKFRFPVYNIKVNKAQTCKALIINPAPEKLRSLVQKEILEDLHNGNPRVVNALHIHFYQSLCDLADNFIADRPAAQDIVTDVFLQLWRKHKDFIDLKHVRCFLYRSTKNACLNVLRHRTCHNKMEKVLLTLQSDIYYDFGFAQIDRRESHAQLYEAMEFVPKQAREIVRMMLSGDLSNKDIANKLQISVSTVKTQKTRAFKILRKRLAAHRN